MATMGGLATAGPLRAIASLLLFLRAASAVEPISFAPNGQWDGVDGTWSSFDLDIGTPAQTVRVFPTWQSYQTWAILPLGCPSLASQMACISGRGGLFTPTSSTSYTEEGLFGLTIENNLGMGGDAQYGFDNVGLGATGPVVRNSTVVGIATNDFYVGLFGLDPKPTNYSGFTLSSPSYMTLLHEQDLTPSISFGYTAGANYRSVTGSLTIGGYDASRLVANSIQFPFGTDNDQYTMVALQSITTPGSGTTTQLLPTPGFYLIDPTIAELWLPIEACNAFESAFGLTFDSTSGLYLVDESLHTTLLSKNASVTLTIGTQVSGGSTVEITLPYAAFDLTATPPYASLTTSSSYFPLRQAQNSSQYTLGRTFMQEAYVSVDYGRSTFNVSQVDWTTASPNIIPISFARAATPIGVASSSTGTMKTSTIAGIAIGTVIILALISAVLVGYFKRRSKRRHTMMTARSSEKSYGGRDSGSSRPFTAVGSDAGSEGSHGSSTLYDGSHGPQVYAKYQDSVGSRSPGSDDKIMSPYSMSSNESPHTPFSSRGRGYYSFTKSAISPSTPAGGSLVRGSTMSPSTPIPTQPSAVIWAGEKDGGQIYEMPGSIPVVPQADGKEVSRTPVHSVHLRRPGDQITSPVSAMSPMSRRQRSAEMSTGMRSMAFTAEEITSPQAARSSAPAAVYPPRFSSTAAHRSYGQGDDDEYQSPAF